MYEEWSCTPGASQRQGTGGGGDLTHCRAPFADINGKYKKKGFYFRCYLLLIWRHALVAAETAPGGVAAAAALAAEKGGEA